MSANPYEWPAIPCDRRHTCDGCATCEPMEPEDAAWLEWRDATEDLGEPPVDEPPYPDPRSET